MDKISHGRYNIKVFDYCILDNHVHMVVYLESVAQLGGFMRLTSSLIARRINEELVRQNHVLGQRYSSPIITHESYIINTITYVG